MSRLSEGQKLFIRENAPEMSKTEMSKSLGVSWDRVSHYCSSVGIVPVSGNKSCPVGCTCWKHSESFREKVAGSSKERWSDPVYSKRVSRRISEVLTKTGYHIDKSGYKILSGHQGHPLNTSGGSLFEHRKVLYEKIGPGTHECHWCGRELEWGGRDGIFVDHLDWDRLNNVPENLVPSCNSCNIHRLEEVTE